MGFVFSQNESDRKITESKSKSNIGIYKNQYYGSVTMNMHELSDYELLREAKINRNMIIVGQTVTILSSHHIVGTDKIIFCIDVD